MRSRRSVLVSAGAALALVLGAIAAPAYAADPPPDFTGGAVSPEGPAPITATRAPSCSLTWRHYRGLMPASRAASGAAHSITLRGSGRRSGGACE